MIQHQNRQAADKRTEAAAYYQSHLEATPEVGSRADFDRDFHQAEYERLTAQAERFEATSADFRGDLFVRQGGRNRGNEGGLTVENDQNPPSAPGGETAELERIKAEASALLPPEPPAPQQETEKSKDLGLDP